MEPVYVKAFDIPGAWYKVVEAVMKNGINQKLQDYDEYAKTVYNLVLYITNPGIRPISCEIAGYNDDMIFNYFANYFFGGIETDHEHNYGMRLKEPIDQFQLVADMLKEYPYTRRAVMIIARPEDLTSKYAPCIRELQFYCMPPDYKEIRTTVFVRSWDTYMAGNPDLGSFQLAAEVIGKMVGKPNGPLTVLVTNAHIYKKSLEIIQKGSMRQGGGGKSFYNEVKGEKYA